MRKRYKITTVLLAFATTLFILVLGIGAYMVKIPLVPNNNDGRDVEGSYNYIRQTYPEVGVWVDSLKTAQALRDTFIVNEKGHRLHALFVAAAQPNSKTAVIVHGYTGSAVRMLMIGHLYNHDLGYNILLPDLYNSGLSDGEHFRMGWLDRYDLLRWMELTNELFGGDTQMVVHGISMGATTLMMASGDPQQGYVKCFVEDCGYTDVWSEFAYHLKRDYGLPEFPIMYAANLWCKLRYGWSFREASAIEQLKKCSLPMLFIHSKEDTYVPTSMVHSLYDAKKRGDRTLWIAPNGAHAMSYRDNKEAYTAHIRSFTEKYID